MRSKFVVVGASFLVLVLWLSGCGPGPTQGIAVASKNCIGDPSAYPALKCLPGSKLMLTPNVPVWGNVVNQYYSNGVDQTKGTIDSFGHYGDPPASTGSSGVLVVNNAEAPAYWNLNWLEPWNCGYNTDPQNPPVYTGGAYYNNSGWWGYEALNVLVDNYYVNKKYVSLDCATFGPLLPASTRFAILGSLPGTITLGGFTPFTTNYGMPLLYVYDKGGNLVANETATNVSNDGSQATFPFPSSLTESGYSVAVLNKISQSPGAIAAGTNLLSIANRESVPGNPFGVAVGSGTMDYSNCNWDPDYGQYCWSGRTSYSLPVVSLYSNNQVRISNSVVDVGPNPTAVVTNSAGSASVSNDDGNGNTQQLDYTGSTIAVVANSGGNTVSIVDIINGVVLFNVRVGNKPVALAMSSDGSTAYVANYQDSTVTKVNVNSGTTTATVAVGGQPTSVALTATGTLWVGGTGFLSQINTSNMSVVATESIAGKTIAALGFSDAENELVATTTDASGNVNVDEVSPSSVQPGGTYAAIASHQVSSLGTYLNPQTQIQVHGFTSTLATSSVPINTNLPGASPLVVQDGWAVVTATPTGFTITDLSGHIVLISETTPSPIAAIAVDTNLSVAYLTMPDSNTLLTVPLPGVGSTN